MSEGHIADPPPPKRLLWLTLIAFGAGTLAFFLFVMPAEFHVDLTGFGRATGLDRLAGPKEVAVEAPAGAAPLMAVTQAEFRTDIIEIPLGPGDEILGSELEYKVRMKKGDALVYAWQVEPKPPEGEFYYDLHSQSDAQPDIKVLSFKQALGSSERGALTAPFDGIHGWYLQNQSLSPVKVKLKLAGFYTLVSAEELEAAIAAAAGVQEQGASPPQ